jgi:multidrug resistance protein MdtO
MATAVTSLHDNRPSHGWFVDFLKQELAPYPDRGSTVARMVIAATLVMLIIMIFRIPNAAAGPVFAFLFARDSLASSVRTTVSVVCTFAAGMLFIPFGARMFASEPMTHFLWVAATLFALFFLLRAQRDYGSAVTTAIVGATAVATWYLPGPGERNVENTLWGMFVGWIGVVVCLVVEIVYRAIYKDLDDVVDGITSRLSSMEELLRNYANNIPSAPETKKMLAQYAFTGAGILRRRLIRVENDPLYQAQMTAVVSLTARSIDFAAVIASEQVELSLQDRQRFSQLAQHVSDIRESLIHRQKPEAWELAEDTPSSIRMLPDLERMIATIPQVFQGSVTLGPNAVPAQNAPKQKFKLFKDDAFRNPEYIRFASYGCLAAMLCYVAYTTLAWPGLFTSVQTCLLTALSDVGSSRQKQILRFAGGIIGGFVFGMGSQILILPYIDSITGFTILFASVVAIAAWIATSSPRLSYCGTQIAVAFSLVTLGEFKFHTSLTAERDRAVGVLLGVCVMGLVFRLARPKPAAQQMFEAFIRNLRTMSQLVVHPSIRDTPERIPELYTLREQIADNFLAVSSAAEAVSFETGTARVRETAAKEKIQRWQTVLRAFYLMEMPLLQFYHFNFRTEVSDSVRQVEIRFHQSCGAMLNSIADCLEKQLGGGKCDLQLHPDLQGLLRAATAEGKPLFSTHEETVVALSRNIASLLDKLEKDVHAAPLFATT